MLRKSKSMMVILCLTVLGMIGMLVGAFFLHKTNMKTFSEDGYILTADAQAGAENVLVSERVWFRSGTSWKGAKGEEVSFFDTEGSIAQFPKKSFL